jgi:hypothetical protein
MREQIRIWIGAAVVVAIYVLMCSVLDEQQNSIEPCSVMRCV